MFTHIFVYGTLKTGQVRESCWPVSPTEIRRAWTLGRLYDTGAYPALVLGNDRVAGELWTFADSDAPEIFAVLDEIEGTNQPGFPNEYDRIIRDVHLLDETIVAASLYVFARTERLQHFTYLPPQIQPQESQQVAVWPAGAVW